MKLFNLELKNHYFVVAIILVLFIIFIPFSILRIVFGSILVMFVPGFMMTMALFEGNEIDNLERFILSIALSISVVPVAILILNIAFDMPIRIITIIGVLFLISAISGAVYFYRYKNKSKTNKRRYR